MVSKGPDAFRTISEVAAELSLPQHVLRFWETRFSQIRPLKRGGGRRYYRPDDVDLLRGIRHLLYGEGYTIRGVQRILKEQGARYAIATGRGEAGSIPPPHHDEIDDFEDSAPEAAMNGESVETVARPIYRPPPAHPSVTNGHGHGHVGEPAVQLTEAEKAQLQETLSELLELKRLLDQSR
jgi:DNA-binding transcriptional MerR regulator